jgi:hypothetical protein
LVISTTNSFMTNSLPPPPAAHIARPVATASTVRSIGKDRAHPTKWPGSVAYTLTRYGGLFEVGTDAAVDRLDNLLGGTPLP